jgi:hypothetical protein
MEDEWSHMNRIRGWNVIAMELPLSLLLADGDERVRSSRRRLTIDLLTRLDSFEKKKRLIEKKQRTHDGRTTSTVNGGHKKSRWGKKPLPFYVWFRPSGFRPLIMFTGQCVLVLIRRSVLYTKNTHCNTPPRTPSSFL